MNKSLFSLLILWLNALISIAQPGAIDLSFNPGTGANDQIRGVALQPDGKIIIGGDFITYNDTTTNYIARLNTDGSLDTSFHTGTGMSSIVRAIAIQSDGKIVAVGDFQSYNSFSTRGIIRLNTDGSTDTNFHSGTGFNNSVLSLAIQNFDGKILIGGLFTDYNGTPCNRLVRLNTDGSTDTTFNTVTGADGSIEDMVIQPDGKIIIGGDFNNYWGDLCIRVARVNTDGSRDSSFSALPGASAVVFAVSLQTDGKIIVGGNFGQYDFQPRNHIARLQTNGDLDPLFYVNQGGNADVQDIRVLNNSEVLFGGSFTTFKTRNINRLALVDSNCNVDTIFDTGSGAEERINIIRIQPDGKIIIAGIFTSYNGIARNCIARLYNCITTQPGPITGSDSTMCANALTYSIAPVPDATSYQWTLPQGWTGNSDSTSITVISNGQGGVISVNAFNDSCGYSAAQTKTIIRIDPPGVPLCLVTVDTASTHNIVIWEKPHTTLIDSFFIYREITTNNYSKIAAIPFDSLSEYHDYAADPNTTSFRYKLSTLDKCGVESAQCLFHNTIHLQNLGSGNFQWTFYQIENSLNPVLSFNMYRDNLDNGNFFPIGNVPGTNATFTDVTYSSFPNAIYVIDANWGISCNPTRAVSTTRSNIRHISFIDLGVAENTLSDKLQVYPNPAERIVNLIVPSTLNVTGLKLFNAIGQLIWSDANESVTVNNTNQIKLDNYVSGFYTLAIETNMGTVNRKLIIQ